MLQLIETICFENGIFHRIPLHQERMTRARTHFFNCTDTISLAAILEIPEILKNHKVKCRISYSRTIDEIEYEIYFPKQIQKLQCVYEDTIWYDHKLKNRDALRLLLDKRGTAEEVLIVKNGFITDASYANVVLRKENKWYTPELPLLPGTRRAQYLQNGHLSVAQIKPSDLCQYDELRLINAMLSIEESATIPIDQILL
jgi:4-amino-4-deoxychorismate lyase